MISSDFSELYVKGENNFCFSQEKLLSDLFKGAVLKWNSIHSLWKFVREWWDGCGVMQNDRQSQNAMLHRKPQSLRKKTHVWLLKTYLFFLGGSKILKRKGSLHWNIITFFMLFNLAKSLHHKTIYSLISTASYSSIFPNIFFERYSRLYKHL